MKLHPELCRFVTFFARIRFTCNMLPGGETYAVKLGIKSRYVLTSDPR